MSRELPDDQRCALRALLRSDRYDGTVAARAQIVLLWGDGHSVAAITEMVGTTKPTVYKWVDRYAREGVDGLTDRKSPGRPPEVLEKTRSRIVALTRQTPPAETGLSHWSSREMAKYLKREEGVMVSHSFVADLWREHDLKPHQSGTFKLSNDPNFAVKVMDVVGLYLDPPADAVVLSIDEKTQVQALDRTQPVLPMNFGKTEKRTHDYICHGTTNLFAALNTATGDVIGKCFDRRRTTEFLRFMDQVVSAHVGRELHVVLDNLSTHKGEEVDGWLAKNPTVTFHFTPTGSSWLNQVETWFGNITRQAIRRGTFKSLRALVDTINNYIATWNADSKPFAWTTTADEIIAKVTILDRDYKKLVANNSG
ncbi:MAG: IS630 family transposase [Streptosporangiaceae bacterium]